MDKKDNEKFLLKILMGFSIFLAVLLVAFVIVSSVLLRKYGGMSIEDVPFWVVWFLGMNYWG